MVQQTKQEIKTAADYKTAAQDMPQQYLGESFAVGGTDFEKEAAALALIKANARELAQLSGSGEGMILTSAATAIKANQDENGTEKNGKKKADKGGDTARLVFLLDQLDNRIKDLGDSIANRIEGLEARLGDAWIEIVAGQVLDPDETPIRQEGESIPEWRQRVLDAMEEKMIDPETGEIRDEYKNHPDQNVRETAALAQEQYDKEKLEELKGKLDDPNLTDAEKRELIEEYNQSDTGSRLELDENLNADQMAEYDVSPEDNNNLAAVANSRTGPENLF